MITTSAHGLGFKVECMGFLVPEVKERLEREAADHLAAVDELTAQELYWCLSHGHSPYKFKKAWALVEELRRLGSRKEPNWEGAQAWFKLGHVA